MYASLTNDYYYDKTGHLDWVNQTNDPDKFFQPDENGNMHEMQLYELTGIMRSEYNLVSANLASGAAKFSEGIYHFDRPELGGSFSPVDGISQIGNMGTILFTSSALGIQGIRHLNDGQGAQLLGRSLGFGTQRTAAALRNTLSYVNKIGLYTGYVGQAWNTAVYFGKVFDPNATLTTGDHVGFWTGTAVWGTSLLFASNPFVLGGAIIYGLGELGSWAWNGKSLEQNIFDK